MSSLIKTNRPPTPPVAAPDNHPPTVTYVYLITTPIIIHQQLSLVWISFTTLLCHPALINRWRPEQIRYTPAESSYRKTQEKHNCKRRRKIRPDYRRATNTDSEITTSSAAFDLGVQAAQRNIFGAFEKPSNAGNNDSSIESIYVAFRHYFRKLCPSPASQPSLPGPHFPAPNWYAT